MRLSEGKEVRRAERHQWKRLRWHPQRVRLKKMILCEEIQEGRADREEKQLNRWSLIRRMKEASIGK